MSIAAILDLIAKLLGEFEHEPVEEPAENATPTFNRTILIDPGHGLYLTDGGVWNFQRDEWHGIIEDTTVMQIAKHLVPKLTPMFRRVYCTRPLPGTAEGDATGRSGHPRWKEAALYYLRSILDGHERCADVCERGSRERYRDINCRPLYGEFLEVGVMVGVHTNAAPKDKINSPTAHGVSLQYRTGDRESRELSGLINAELKVRFHSRGLKPRLNDLSFFRRSNMPAALAECLFHTNKADCERLHNELNLVFIASAIAEGIRKYFETKETV